MSKILKYIQFITENMNSDKVDSVSAKFPIIKDIYKYVKYGNFAGVKKPITDKEMLENDELLKKSVKKFDELFKTDYYTKHGMDYSTLLNDPTINKVYYGDVVKFLIMSSFDINVYQNIFNFESNTIEDFVYKFIIFKLVKKEVADLENEFKNKIMKNVPKAVNKKMFLYKFFKHFGSQFNVEIIEEVMGISKKNMYELGGLNVKAHKNMQKLFLSTLKKELDKYKDIIKTDVVIDNVLNNILNFYNDGNTDITNVIHDKYIVVKLKEYLDYLESILK